MTQIRLASEAVSDRARPRLRVGLTCLVLAGTALAAAPGNFDFVIHTADGGNLTGTLQKLSADGSIRLGGSPLALVAGSDVVTVRRANVPLPSYPRENVVIFTHGDRVPFDPAKSIKMAEGRLTFHIRPRLREQAVNIPRAFIALIWLGVSEGDADQDLSIQRLLASKRTQDAILLRNGDQVEGTVTTIEPGKSVVVETGARKLDLPLGQVTAIAFNTELQARIRFPKRHTHVILTNGGRLSFGSLQLDTEGAGLAGKTLFGARVLVPVADVVALEPRSARVVYLSDLKPASFLHTPFSGISWSLTADTAVTGRSLRLAGNTYDKGLGMHTKSTAVYHLDDKYRWFEATVGLDERSGRLGRTCVHVLVDGKEQPLGSDKELTATDPPLSLRISVAGARQLTLTADFGSYGDVQGHVDWADARLIR